MKAFTAIIFAVCAVSLNAEAPGYPPSGWKPNGRLLALPSRVQEAPKPVYGPPPTFAPNPTYGPPSTPEFAATTDIPNTTPVASAEDSSETEGSASGQSSAQQQDTPNVESGLYYVLLPDGRLQRVEYLTAPLGAFETEKQTAFPGFPGFEVKPLKIQNPPSTATQFQVGAFQGNQNQGFNSNQNNQAQASSGSFGFNKVQVKGQYQSAAFIQPFPAQPEETFAPSSQAQYFVAPNPAAISAFGSFQQYQAQRAQQEVAQRSQQQQQVESVATPAAGSAPFQGFVSNVQYKDVEPINAPVYAYNTPQQQFVRILKK